MTATLLPFRGLNGGMQLDLVDEDLAPPALLATSLLIDATGEKIAYVGRYWNPQRASKTIDGVEFLTGALTSAGGSELTISLQTVLLTTGPPGRPNESTPLASVTDVPISTFTASTWSGIDFADTEAVTYGQLLAVVWEFDAGGRLGADAFRLSGMQSNIASFSHTLIANLKTGGTWANLGVVPNVVFRHSDGTFGTLQGAFIASSITSHSIASNTTPDEIAVGIAHPVPVSMDTFCGAASLAGDTDLVLYTGTTALDTVSMDANTVAGGGGYRQFEAPFPPRALTASTLYRLAYKPTTTTLSIYYSVNVNDAAFVAFHGFDPTNGHYWERTDAGAWGGELATRVLFMGYYLSHFDDGAGSGSGGGPLVGPGRLVR